MLSGRLNQWFVYLGGLPRWPALRRERFKARKWQALAGAETLDRGSQAVAFFAERVVDQCRDSIRRTFLTHERHIVIFLIPAGPDAAFRVWPHFWRCDRMPGTTPDGSSFDGSSCVTSDVLLVPEDAGQEPTYSVTFPRPATLICLSDSRRSSG